MALPTLEHSLVQSLIERQLTLGLAESCTGGLIAHRLTNVPGSSNCFLGGIVAYSPKIKEKLVGVPSGTLATYGVVSAEVALALARGARHVLGTDLGLGVTGIAGPGGGASDKPVGLVYIALSAPNGERTERLTLDKDRLGVKTAAADAALALVNAYLATVPHTTGPKPHRAEG